jgi:hypothetical protein
MMELVMRNWTQYRSPDPKLGWGGGGGFLCEVRTTNILNLATLSRDYVILYFINFFPPNKGWHYFKSQMQTEWEILKITVSCVASQTDIQ